jgi:hypothetical protein
LYVSKYITLQKRIEWILKTVRHRLFYVTQYHLPVVAITTLLCNRKLSSVVNLLRQWWLLKTVTQITKREWLFTVKLGNWYLITALWSVRHQDQPQLLCKRHPTEISVRNVRYPEKVFDTFLSLRSKLLGCYEAESVNRSQLDTKRRTCDIQTLRNIYLSTYFPPALIHLSHRFTGASETAAEKSLVSQPLPHLRFNLFVISETFVTNVQSLYATTTSHHKQETFLYEYPVHWVLLSTKKRTTERCSSVGYPQARSPLWLMLPASEHAHVRLLPRIFHK